MAISFKKIYLLYFFLAIILGLLVVGQFYAQENINAIQSKDEVASTAFAISAITDENAKLRENIEELLNEKDDYDKAINNQDLVGLEDRLNDYKKSSGYFGVKGEGVEINISGNVAAYHFLDILNNLRNASAEAIGVNDIRIVINSSVTEDHGRIFIDGISIKSPYTVIALGNKDLLSESMIRTGGIINELDKNLTDVRFETITRDDIYLGPSKMVE